MSYPIIRRGGSDSSAIVPASVQKVPGEYVFSSLMKQKKKAKNYAVFCFAGKRKLFFLYL